MDTQDRASSDDLPEPDLAQLLVLEAGRLLEDLTPGWMQSCLPEFASEHLFDQDGKPNERAFLAL